MKISIALKGKNSPLWQPKLHTGETVKCACGCGEKILKHDKKGRRRYYLKGHYNLNLFENAHTPWNKGKKWDSETIKKILTRRTPNKQENFLINFFTKHNLPYKFVGDGSIIIDGRNPDFINYNGQKKIIEFFGEHWHEPEDEEIKRQIYSKYG